MKLSKEQTENLLKKLSESNITKCPICNSNNLIVVDVVFEVREFQQGVVILGGSSKIIPLIALNCGNCGYIMFFNAKILGIIESND